MSSVIERTFLDGEEMLTGPLKMTLTLPALPTEKLEACKNLLLST